MKNEEVLNKEQERNEFERLTIEYESWPCEHKMTRIEMKREALVCRCCGNFFGEENKKSFIITDKERFLSGLKSLELQSWDSSFGVIHCDGTMTEVNCKLKNQPSIKILFWDTFEYKDGELEEYQEYKQLREFLDSFGIGIER